MKKFECSNEMCETPCFLTCEDADFSPTKCPFDSKIYTRVDWHEVKEEKDEKPELPDWCKVGEWIYDENSDKYFKIEKVNENNLFCNGFHTNTMEGIRQARVRPWTFEEAFLMLKVRRIDEKSYVDVLQLDVDLANEPNFIYYSTVSDEYFLCEWASKFMEQLDGSPCGVLEHLNDNGKWVK